MKSQFGRLIFRHLLHLHVSVLLLLFISGNVHSIATSTNSQENIDSSFVNTLLQQDTFSIKNSDARISFYNRIDSICTSGISKSLDPEQKQFLLTHLKTVTSTLGEINYAKGEYENARTLFLRNKKICEQTNDQSNLALSLIRLGNIHKNQGNYEEALQLFNRSLSIRTQLSDKKGRAQAYNSIGNVYKHTAEYDLAKAYYDSSLNLCIEIEAKKGMATAYNNIGSIFYYKGDYSNTIDYYQKSLRLKEEFGDLKAISITLYNIGIIYKIQGDLVRGKDYYERSLAIKKELQDKRGIATLLNSIGDIHFLQKDYDSTFYYFRESYKLSEEMGNRFLMATTLNNIGNTYFEQNDYNNALKQYTSSLEIKRIIGSNRGISASLNNIGKVYYEQKKFSKALNYCKQAYELGVKIGAVTEIKKAANSLWKIHKSLGHYEKSLEMYEVYAAYQDSVYSEDKRREIIRLEYQYKYEKEVIADSIKTLEAIKTKDAELTAEVAKSSQEKQLKYFFFALFAIAVIFGAFVFNRYRIASRQKETIKGQKETLESTLIELNSAQDQLVQSKKMASIGILTAGLAHELNNPLNYIGGVVEPINKDIEELMEAIPESIREEKQEEIEEIYMLLQGISDGTSKAANIIRNLMAITPEYLEEKSSFSLSELMNDLVQSVNEEHKDVQVTGQIVNDAKIIGNRMELWQAVSNVIKNSIESLNNTSDKRVEINLSEINYRNVIEIKDNGSGIDEPHLNQIFEPFFTTKEPGKGTGLGLYFTYSIVKKHGGSVFVDSNLNSGTTITISIPVVSEE